MSADAGSPIQALSGVVPTSPADRARAVLEAMAQVWGPDPGGGAGESSPTGINGIASLTDVHTEAVSATLSSATLSADAPAGVPTAGASVAMLSATDWSSVGWALAAMAPTTELLSSTSAASAMPAVSATPAVGGDGPQASPSDVGVPVLGGPATGRPVTERPAAEVSPSALQAAVQMERMGLPTTHPLSAALATDPSAPLTQASAAPIDPMQLSQPGSMQQVDQLAAVPVQLNSMHVQAGAQDTVPVLRRHTPPSATDIDPWPPQRDQSEDEGGGTAREDEGPDAEEGQDDPLSGAHVHRATKEAGAQASASRHLEWTYAELEAWLRRSALPAALASLGAGRKLLVIMPMKHHWQDVHQGARVRRACLMWKDPQGQGRVLALSARWWPGPDVTSPAAWGGWRVHREQSMSGAPQLRVSAAGGDTLAPLQLRLCAPGGAQHLAPALPLECIDLYDTQGLWRQLRQQWSLWLVRAPVSLEASASEEAGS